jgi:hypothetical protein
VLTVGLPDGAEALELAHDSLLTEWKELRDWIEEDRIFRRWRDRLIARMQDTPDDLLSGAALLEAERMLEGEVGRTDLASIGLIAAGQERTEIGTVRFDPRIREFIARSRAAEQVRVETVAARLKAERDAALRMGSLFLADRARQATAQGDAMTGMLLALEALPDPASEHPRPVIPEAIFALHEAWARNRERICLVSGGSVNHAAFSPDGARILTASGDGTALVWNAITGACLTTCKGHTKAVNHAAFSRDGTRILTGSGDGTARLWDAATGARLATWEGHTGGVYHAAFSPDSARILTASDDGTARLWDAVTGACFATCEGHTNGVNHAAFSRDGARIITASWDGTARLWDAATGACVATCEGHTGGLCHAAFSPDGAHILTASNDCTARVWDAATGVCLATHEGHAKWLSHAAFSPDGARIVTASWDRTARVWRRFRDVTDLVAFVTPRLTRGLTARQRRDNYLPPLLPDAPSDLEAIPPIIADGAAQCETP